MKKQKRTIIKLALLTSFILLAYYVASALCLLNYEKTDLKTLGNFMIGSKAKNVLAHEDCRLVKPYPYVSVDPYSYPFQPTNISCETSDSIYFRYGFSYSIIKSDTMKEPGHINGFFYRNSNISDTELDNVMDELNHTLGTPTTELNLSYYTKARYITWKKGRINAEAIYRKKDNCHPANELHVYIYHDSVKSHFLKSGQARLAWANSPCKNEIPPNVE